MSAAAAATAHTPVTLFQKLTPVILVDAITPCLPFWTERLGFANVAEVPGPDGKPQFAMLVRDGIEVMYQTRARVQAEAPAAMAGPVGHSIALYLDVKNLAEVEQAMAGVLMVAPRHKTFYGTEEFSVREPGGAVVTFAMHVAQG